STMASATTSGSSCWLAVARTASPAVRDTGGEAGAPGRLRAEVAKLVRTPAGHTTDTPTPEPSARSSFHSTSLTAITAALLALYGAMYGPVTSPAIDAVLTTWPAP